jgi:hemoglobin
MKSTLLAVAALALLGCAGPQEKPSAAAAPAPAPAAATLYGELGGTEGITKVVDLFLARINGDARINTLFAKTDHNDLRRLVIEQLCEGSGGPCKYTGRSMEEAHSGLNLTNADFSAFMGDLVAAMDEAKVPLAQQNKLIALLMPMKPQVVGQ